MINISFAGAKVYANPNMYIKNARASEIAEAINIGVKQASNELGQPLHHPVAKKMSGTLLKEINPDSFDKKTQTLTEQGKEGFNKIYGKQFGVTVESKLKDLMHCVKNVAMQRADENGVINYCFKYMA